MCGVIGAVGGLQPDVIRRVFEQSRIRGLHAFGAAWLEAGAVRVSRSLTWEPIDALVSQLDTPALLLHARYSTSGDWQVLDNNQPLMLNGTALVFNGVISMATQAEMERQYNVQLTHDNDGELFLRWLAQGLAVAEVARLMQGSFAGCWLTPNGLSALRNVRRPLWRAQVEGMTLYASTADILRRAGIDGAVAVAPDQVESWIV